MNWYIFTLFILIAVLPCLAQHTIDLGVNPTTDLEEIRVILPGLSEDVKQLDMVLLPGASFMMGSPESERGREDENDWSLLDAGITAPFYIGVCEITQAQWEAVMGENPSSMHGTPYGIGPDYPIYYVSWDDCIQFIENINTLGPETFQLPTEMQWEYACRAGTSTRFSFGDALECSDDSVFRCAIMDANSWWIGNRLFGGIADGAQPIATKLPNLWGLYDMHGNISEWCLTGWQDPYIPTPGIEPPTVSESFRVIRGGYWYSYTKYCRSSSRRGQLRDVRHYSIGFRLVMTVDEPSTIENFAIH